MQAGDLNDPAVASVLKDEIERKNKKARFGDNMGRLGRRHKGAGKHFDEEAARFNKDDDDDDDDDMDTDGGKRKRAESSMKTGRAIKEVQEAGEDWEHDEDSEEENERRQYENESGYRIEPFNTDMEREEGHFDESTGHYVEDRFKVSQRDAWLEEVQDKYAHGLVAKVSKKKQDKKEEMEEEEVQVDKAELLKLLHGNVHEGENLAKAMRRIKAGAKDKDGGEQALLDKLTDAADKLLTMGYHNVFTDNKTQIGGRLQASQQQAQTKEQGASQAEAFAAMMAFDDGRQWEYQFPQGEFKPVDFKPMGIKELKAYLDGEGVKHAGLEDKEDFLAKAKQTQDRKKNAMSQNHGPFTTGQMRCWNMHGYFAPPRTILVRQVGSGEFYSSDKIDLEEMLA